MGGVLTSFSMGFFSYCYTRMGMRCFVLRNSFHIKVDVGGVDGVGVADGLGLQVGQQGFGGDAGDPQVQGLAPEVAAVFYAPFVAVVGGAAKSADQVPGGVKGFAEMIDGPVGDFRQGKVRFCREAAAVPAPAFEPEILPAEMADVGPVRRRQSVASSDGFPDGGLCGGAENPIGGEP